MLYKEESDPPSIIRVSPVSRVLRWFVTNHLRTQSTGETRVMRRWVKFFFIVSPLGSRLCYVQAFPHLKPCIILYNIKGYLYFYFQKIADNERKNFEKS